MFTFSRPVRIAFRGVAALLFAFTLAACNGSDSASAEPSFNAQVDALIDSAQTTNRVPSICAAIGKKGNVIYSHCSGMIDIAGGTPATPTSIYQIGSITKQFTTVAIMMLANQNPPALALSDPITRYIPALTNASTVTLETTMNMSSGLVDYTTLPQVPQWYNGVAPGTVISALVPFGLHFPAGTAFEYSNSNMFLLGVVIEHASGMTYGNFLQRRILGPNNLTSISYGPSPTGPNAVGYTRDDKGDLTVVPNLAPSASYAAGALNSNVLDIVKWDWLFLGGQVLPSKLVAQMTAPPPINGSSHSEPSVYGFGVNSTELYGRPIVMHGGRVPGFNAITSTFTDTGFSVMAVTNIDVTGYVIDTVWRQIVDRVCAPTSEFQPQC